MPDPRGQSLGASGRSTAPFPARIAMSMRRLAALTSWLSAQAALPSWLPAQAAQARGRA
ncbi:MAG: hypothetical protein LBT40_04300 [Deltaproteobacteria bacterium]|jgi:hypothetical protein|nr:hypothetical protein [Deltaproteobacteria bacterium]